MRTLLLATALFFTACAPPDLLPGTYEFNLTGTETETAPRNQTTMTGGTGYMTVTPGKSVDYLVTLAQSDATPCLVEATRDEKTDVISIKAEQKCTFVFSGGNVTASLTSGTLSGTEKGETATLEVNYTYAGSTFGINFAGTGRRTYAGNRR